MEACGFLLLNFSIIVGDFNCTLREGKTWGVWKRREPLNNSMSSLFELSNLVDMSLEREGPTWFNRCLEDEFIGK